jgi:hypothetical protein
MNTNPWIPLIPTKNQIYFDILGNMGNMDWQKIRGKSIISTLRQQWNVAIHANISYSSSISSKKHWLQLKVNVVRVSEHYWRQRSYFGRFLPRSSSHDDLNIQWKTKYTNQVKKLNCIAVFVKDIHIFNGYVSKNTWTAKSFPLQILIHYNIHNVCNFVLFKVTMGSDSLAYMTWAKNSNSEEGRPLRPTFYFAQWRCKLNMTLSKRSWTIRV